MCADDAELRQRIDGLLAAREVAPEFLEENSARMALTIIADDEINEEGFGANFPFLKPSEKSGCLGTLNQYEIVGVIGRGAFGIVFPGLRYKAESNRCDQGDESRARDQPVGRQEVFLGKRRRLQP